MDSDETAKLGCQVGDRLDVRDFPVKESTQVGQIVELETKELLVETHVVLLVDFVLAVHALGDQEVLASVDHIVDLALDIPQLFLLRLQLKRLLKLGNLTVERVDLLDIGSRLHPQLVVVLDQLLDLVLKSLMVQRLQLVLEACTVETNRS